MLIALAALCLLVVLIVWLLMQVPDGPDPVDEAYHTLPAGRPELRVDTTTGAHDRLPIQEDIRQMLTDYCEGMWQHTQPATTEES